ncbi:MAG: carbohydrate kinase family protein [Lentisphaeria bacterium]
MKKVVCFGEVLIDFLNTGSHADGPLQINHFAQYPGGAPANAAVAASCLGVPTAFAGQVGDDHFGHYLLDSLKAYGVDTSLCPIHPTAKTPLAFVFLDNDGERSFEFYRDRSADLEITTNQVTADWFNETAIFHCCSNTLTNPNIATTTIEIMQKASQAGAVLTFDVNLRHNLWENKTINANIVNEAVKLCQVIKFAKEELEFLAAGDETGYINNLLNHNTQLVLITDGPNPINVYSKSGNSVVNPPKVKAVDTNAGGDAFTGGIIAGIFRLGKPVTELTIDEINSLVFFASNCGGYAVSRPGAFTSLPSWENVKQHWSF